MTPPEVRCCSFQIGTVCLEVVDQRAARLQRRPAVHGAGGDHDRQVAHLEVADPVLDRDGADVVAAATRSALASSAVRGRRVLGVVERGDLLAESMLADHADEDRDPAGAAVADQAEQPVHAQWRSLISASRTRDDMVEP